MLALIFPLKMYHKHMKRQIGKNVDSSKYPESFAMKLLSRTQVHRNSGFMLTTEYRRLKQWVWGPPTPGSLSETNSRNNFILWLEKQVINTQFLLGYICCWFFLTLLIWWCGRGSVYVHMPHTHGEVRPRLSGAGTLFPSRASQGSNSGHH